MSNRILAPGSLHTDLATLLLRLLLGGLMAWYGYNKFSAYHTMLPQFGDIIGIGSKLSFNLLIFAELFCGLFVAIGLLTRLTVIPIFIAMVVAYFIAHGKDPFDTKSLAFVFMCLSVIVFILGSGKYSVDRLLFRKGHTS